MIGQNVIGNWGAMIPWSYGKVFSLDDSSGKTQVIVRWEDDGWLAYYDVTDLKVGIPGSEGIGIYLEETA